MFLYGIKGFMHTCAEDDKPWLENVADKDTLFFSALFTSCGSIVLYRKSVFLSNSVVRS